MNPIWEETCALLVTPELIKADENLSVELWDSDRHSADDIVGKVELSMQKMIQKPGKLFPQVSKLAGMDEGSEMPGELHWDVQYFGKPNFRPALRTDGKNTALPDELKDKPEFQDDKGVVNTAQDDAIMHTPPDPLWPSGVCSIIVHQIVNLELENIKGTSGSRKNKEYEPAKGYGEGTDEEGSQLPTSYCTILLNDELVYRTRAKAISSQPIFNAGTERFVRDWRSAIVTVTVRDQRNRQHDPVLGVVPLKLSDILDTSSQVTRWYPLDGGVGFGRIRISLLFRSIEATLPPPQLGWDVGTFEFNSSRILAVGYDKNAKIKLRTGGSIGKIDRKACKKLEQGDGMYWDIEKVRLPVKYRYRSPVIFEMHVSGKRKADAYAVIWLHHLIDNEETPINIPIWQTSNPARLCQNYVTEENFNKEIGLDDMKEVGRLQFRAQFKAGMDESHEQFIQDNDTRETYETWEACLAEGVRHRTVEKEVPDHVQALHEKSLTDNRDVLKDLSEEDRKQYLAKDGTDWETAFGKDPKNNTDGLPRSSTTTPKPHDPDHPSSDSDSDDDDSADSSDLGIKDHSNKGHARNMSDETQSTTASSMTGTTNDSLARTSTSISTKDANKANRRTEHRKQRGLMQWRPIRNAKFAKDEGKLGLRKLKNKITGGLDGRQPGVETGTYSVLNLWRLLLTRTL